jgi:hypothetical protein
MNNKQKKLLEDIEKNYNTNKALYEKQGKMKYFKYHLVSNNLSKAHIEEYKKYGLRGDGDIDRDKATSDALNVVKGVKHIEQPKCTNRKCIHDVHKLLKHLYPRVDEFHPKFVEAWYPELCNNIKCRCLMWCNALYHEEKYPFKSNEEFEKEVLEPYIEGVITNTYGESYLGIIPQYDLFKDCNGLYSDEAIVKSWHRNSCEYSDVKCGYDSPSDTDIEF